MIRRIRFVTFSPTAVTAYAPVAIAAIESGGTASVASQ